jgi:hypothetical protein
MKVLYGYFGNILEHNLPYPGHPLYQLNFLDSLRNAFGIEKLDVFYYTDEKVDKNICINNEVRSKLFAKLNPNIVNEVNVQDYDALFLKHRFRNASRLKDTHLHDVAVYEDLIELGLSKGIPTYIIDTDASIINSFYKMFPGITIISFFDTSIYPPGISVKKISPTSEILLEEVNAIDKKVLPMFTYDGNNYFKDERLIECLGLVQKNSARLQSVMLGKGWENLAPHIFSREDRMQFYAICQLSGTTSVNLTKPLYEENCFISPRIIESFILGEFCLAPSGYSVLPKDLLFDTNDEFIQKVLYFSEAWSKKALLIYAEEFLRKMKEKGFDGINLK